LHSGKSLDILEAIARFKKKKSGETGLRIKVLSIDLSGQVPLRYFTSCTVDGRGLDVQVESYPLLRRLKLTPARPARPAPRRSRVEGSGTGAHSAVDANIYLDPPSKLTSIAA